MLLSYEAMKSFWKPGHRTKNFQSYNISRPSYAGLDNGGTYSLHFGYLEVSRKKCIKNTIALPINKPQYYRPFDVLDTHIKRYESNRSFVEI